MREANQHSFTITDFRTEITCTLSPSCLNYIEESYPSCFHNAPRSLERLIVNISDYTLVPRTQGKYTTTIVKFDFEMRVHHLRIIYCDRFQQADIEPPNVVSPGPRSEMVRIRRQTRITQNQQIIPYIRYYMHHQAKVNAFSEFQRESVLPISTFLGSPIKKADLSEKRSEKLQVERSSQEIAEIRRAVNEMKPGDCSSVTASEVEAGTASPKRDDTVEMSTQSILSQLDENEIFEACHDELLSIGHKSVDSVSLGDLTQQLEESLSTSETKTQQEDLDKTLKALMSSR